MNEYDSEVIAGAVESMGGIPVERDEEADMIVYNTCCVRKNADNKVYGRIGQQKHLKEQNPDLMIIVTGCLAQKDGEEMLRRFPQVDLVVGTHNLQDLIPLIEEAREKGRTARIDKDGAAFLNPQVRKGNVTAFIPVSIGCDCYCTYCIVPYVRGRLKSRPLEEIVLEAERMTALGFKEIFLLGQNVNTYGFDLPGTPSFSCLLKEIDGIKGVNRIRFTSPHPKDFPQELISAVAELPSVCESVHLPLQSGSDRVLKLMNRKYDTKRYRQIVEGLRRESPGIAISTDLIVGFPGETDEDFRDSMEFIREMQYDQAFMFAYSLRDGTAAAKMPGHLTQEAKLDRLHQLIEMQNDISRAKNESMVGMTKECLVERVSKKDSGMVTGRTRGNQVVNFPGNENMIGGLHMTRLVKAYTWGFMGEPLHPEE